MGPMVLIAATTAIAIIIWLFGAYRNGNNLLPTEQ